MGKAKKQRMERCEMRMTPEVRAKLAAAAEEQQVTVSRFVLEAALERADEVLAGRQTLGLDPVRWEAFAAAMAEPVGSLQRVAKLILRAEFLEDVE
jgi:uncharacterized protein (DUF1778 family)